MTQILVVYGTTDGQTRKIAQAIAESLRGEQCLVDVVDASDVPPQLSPQGYDGVVVAASVQAGGYQQTVKRWVRAHAAALNHTPSAFVSVCLAVREKRPEAHQELERILERFFAWSGWRPSVTKIVAGALRYTRYGWLKKWLIKRIVARAGGDVDTTRDYEYTDWNDLRAFARDFAARLPVGQEAGGLR